MSNLRQKIGPQRRSLATSKNWLAVRRRKAVFSSPSPALEKVRIGQTAAAKPLLSFQHIMLPMSTPGSDVQPPLSSPHPSKKQPELCRAISFKSNQMPQST
jgi:hypothetical protein